MVKASDIKNKIKRGQVYKKEKTRKKKDKKSRQTQRKKEAEELGDAAPPKQVPRTLDNTREFDDTVVEPDDEEVIAEDAMDEFADHFSGLAPKILFTTSKNPSAEMRQFMEILLDVFPNCEYRQRGTAEIKTICEGAGKRGYTALMVVVEKQKVPNGIWFIKLPHGPTADFKLTRLVHPKKIKGHGRTTSHRPELILNNFNTRLGHRMGRMLATIVPYDPQFEGRRVVTLHNQRDFVFFRHHRYMFENGKKVNLQELGPRFTLKLRSLQQGTFDTQHGEYEWYHKADMDTSRRRFFM